MFGYLVRKVEYEYECDRMVGLARSFAATDPLSSRLFGERQDG